jgi:hypothetical protein
VDTVPEFHALLGIDVIDSARTAPHLLPQVPIVLETLLAAGMDAAGVSRQDAVDTQYVGDGWLYAFPSALLGRVVDLARALDPIVAEHNKWNRLELRLRLAVEVGPRPDMPGFQQANLARARLLNAPAFKALARRCIAERPDGSMSTAVIVSDAVHQALAPGHHTRLARPADFAELLVTNKEFTSRAWVAVPGFEARALASFGVDGAPAAAAAPAEARLALVTNTINGNMARSVMAHTVNGGVWISSSKL